MKKYNPIPVECDLCGHIYDSEETKDCPMCRETKEIYDDLFGELEERIYNSD